MSTTEPAAVAKLPSATGLLLASKVKVLINP